MGRTISRVLMKGSFFFFLGGCAVQCLSENGVTQMFEFALIFRLLCSGLFHGLIERVYR